jgi:hypothetical protein
MKTFFSSESQSGYGHSNRYILPRQYAPIRLPAELVELGDCSFLEIKEKVFDKVQIDDVNSSLTVVIKLKKYKKERDLYTKLAIKPSDFSLGGFVLVQ